MFKNKKELYFILLFYILIFVVASYSVGFKSELMMAFGVICLIGLFVYYLSMKLVPDNLLIRAGVIAGTLYIFRYMLIVIF